MCNSEIAISFKLHMTINELMQHFYLYVTVNHYWVSVITNDCGGLWSNDEEKIHSSTSLGREEEKVM